MTFPNTRLEFTSTTKALEDGPTVRKGGHTKLVHGVSDAYSVNLIEFGDLTDFLEVISRPIPAV